MLLLYKSLYAIKNSFPKVWIFGSGPTEYKYQDLREFRDPIIFINDTHLMADDCPSDHKFFVTHHLSKYQRVSPVTIFLRKATSLTTEWNISAESRYFPVNACIAISVFLEDEVTEEFFQQHAWLLNRDIVAEKNTIASFSGSVTTALYISWFMGCLEPTLVGCNPESLTDNHDPRIGGAMIYDPAKIRRNQILLTQILGLKPIYL